MNVRLFKRNVSALDSFITERLLGELEAPFPTVRLLPETVRAMFHIAKQKKKCSFKNVLRQQQRFNIASAAYPESVSFSVATTAPHFLPHVVPWLSRFVFSLCNFEGSYRALCCRFLVSGILEISFFAKGEHEFGSAQNERLKRTV